MQCQNREDTIAAAGQWIAHGKQPEMPKQRKSMLGGSPCYHITHAWYQALSECAQAMQRKQMAISDPAPSCGASSALWPSYENCAEPKKDLETTITGTSATLSNQRFFENSDFEQCLH